MVYAPHINDIRKITWPAETEHCQMCKVGTIGRLLSLYPMLT